jgi:hypothetical protein
VSDPLPPEVTVTELPDGVRYRFPRRRWGPPALMGLGALVGGVLGSGFMSFWLWLVCSHLQVNGGNQGEDGMLLLFVAAGGWMLLMTLRLAVHGLSRLFGHSEIELRGDTLRGIECWGWLRLGWCRPIAGLNRFRVRDALVDDRPGRVYEEMNAATEYNAITVTWDGDAGEQSKQLGRGYPRDWLVPIARNLAGRCRLAAETDGTAEARATASRIDVTAEPLPNPAGFVDLPEQPDDSRVLVARTDDGLRLTLPRKRFGRQQAAVTAFGDRLLVEQRDGSHEWARRQLADIRVARMIDSEGPDTFQVHIDPHPGEGKRVRLILGGEAEARWLATTLRRALAMPDADPECVVFLERAEKPAGCRILEQRNAVGVTLIVPATGYRHPDVRRYLLMAAGFVAAALAAGGILFAVSLEQLADDVRFLPQFLWFLPALLLIGAAGALEEVVRRARRHATFTVIGDTLLVRRTNLYGTRQRQWRRLQVTDVRVGDTLEGRVVNPRTRRAVLDRNDPTWELHIHLRGGEIVRFLDGYGDADLQWLATVLRRALRVGDATDVIPVP